MANHLYLVGDTVALSGAFASKTIGSFKVSALLPPLGDVLQYRVKSTDEPYERVVTEHQLTRLAGQKSAADISLFPVAALA